MAFLDTLLGFLQDLLESLFKSSSPEVKKKYQLKQMVSTLKTVEPPIYRQDGVLLSAFPASLYQIYQFLQPIQEIMKATIHNADKRVADHYRDYLIELALSPEQRAIRKSFLFTERSSTLIAQKMPPEKVIEEQGKQFSSFLKILDSQTMKQVGLLLDKIDALADFCDFDFNSLFSYFDPAFKIHTGKDITVETPSFHTVEVAEIIPALLDLYYLLSKLDVSQAIIDIVSILEARKNNTQLQDDAKNRTNRTFQAISWIVQKKISPANLLCIMRIVKDDPEFKPEQPLIKTDHILQYKTRITDNFHYDSKKLLQDIQANEIQSLLTSIFGDIPLETLQGYNDKTNALIQEFTPFSLEWIKPLEIIKTFSIQFFDPHFKQILRSLIVEGYFNNRSLQSSLSSAYYFCESVSTRIKEFEVLFGDNQPCSIKILTGYLTELEKGMDFEKPLQKMIENMNGHARAFVQQAVNQYSEVFNFSAIIISDNKKTIPEYITNIRTLTSSTKNSESFAMLEREIGVFHNFLEIMKKYAIVGTLSIPASLGEQTES
jgi:hypothetical protein